MLLLKGIYQALRFLRKEKPDVVVGFGSFHSAPLLVAAVLLRKKIILYEANRTMGKVNRWIAPFAKLIGLQFPIPGCGEPKFVRASLRKDGSLSNQQEARKTYGFARRCISQRNHATSCAPYAPSPNNSLCR
jgi:UDP-N-acetylglucosamine:LPS N-acetylglucosamine transferase